MKKLILLLAAILYLINLGYSQVLTQTIRGIVLDKDSRLTLPGASVIIQNSNPAIGTTTDSVGKFRLSGIPVGRQTVQVTYIGYKPVSVQNIIVNSVKEVILEIELEENVVETDEVIIKATRKGETINKMATVSARTFTVEETEKYAGSRGDIARMAMNFAGVSSSNDSRNDIIIRGNSPSGLLWKLEDVEIPNPNHYAESGTTGGPVGMLNNNLLVNSDFFTGAFPAEYGNALSGVFDLKMRNGNNERHEFLFQCGFNGFELGAEGPIDKGHNSSYIANFRYSTIELFDNFMDIGTSGIPKYKDFSFKLNFPLKNGKLTWFGLAGNSEIAMLDSKNDEKDMYSDEGQDLINHSKMATSGLTYIRFLGEKNYLKMSLSGFVQEGGTTVDTLDLDKNPSLYFDHRFTDSRISFNSSFHSKYNSRLSSKIGFNIDRIGFNQFSSVYEKEDLGMRKFIDYNKSITDGPTLFRAFAQASYKFNDQFCINPGFHVSYFGLSSTTSVEPRLGFVWQLATNHKISAGYGLHSQIQAMSVYYYGTHMPDNSLVETNTQLEPTKSHQWILGYETNISENTHLKTEAYYQYIFNVPVEKRSSSFSLLNSGAGWGVATDDSLINDGTGTNYGIEFTLERFFNRNFYYLTTLSLFDSKYKGSDGIERNTAFNGKYVLNVLLGKEFPVSPKGTWVLDFKTTYAGGKFYTPINLSQSISSGEVKYEEEKAFSKQFSSFFKVDIKVGYRHNGKKVSQEWQIYIENLTNHKNVLFQTYSTKKEEISTTYQLGFFPMALYRINF